MYTLRASLIKTWAMLLQWVCYINFFLLQILSEQVMSNNLTKIRYIIKVFCFFNIFTRMFFSCRLKYMI